MKGDISRQTFDPTRHFSTVRLQQGRVQVDADFNEQADIVSHRVETEAADVIGPCGGPLDAAAFGVVLDLDAGDFTLTAGRYYVDGILCEVEAPFPYTAQPDRPPLDPLDVSVAGSTVVYLDVWQRHLTWLDDERLRETALGGPDTATRTRTVWQVRTVFAGTGAIDCADEPDAYLDAIAPSTGKLAARARREAATPDPCLVPSSAGYTGLENQLYRVEVHAPGAAYNLTAAPGDHPVTVVAADRVVYGGGTWSVGQTVEIFRSASGSDPMEGWAATIAAHDEDTDTLTLDAPLPDLAPGDAPRIRPVDATYKWSRDNGSVVTNVVSVSARDVVVGSLGPDEVLGFASGQWVELADEHTELESQPGFLAQIAGIDRDTRTVTLRTDPPAFTGALLKLRRWDGIGAVKTNPPGGAEPYVELENGVQVRFGAGEYHTGDHWLIPARTATALAQSGTIEWPVDAGEPQPLPPAGIRHHHCRLAVLVSDGTELEPQDCRELFPPVTELTSLLYVGGDGQEARPGNAVPKPLQAAVFRGRHPVAGARVRFTADAGGAVAANHGSLPSGAQITFTDVTGADGIAACAWRPANDLGRLSQQVEARLLDAGGDPIAQALRYGAQLSVAAEVAYRPGACADLAGATTVQQALDILCARPTGESCCHVVRAGTPLEEIIRELLRRGERHICLCLEGGEHKLGELKLTREELESLTIESCSGGARLFVGVLELAAVPSVALRNVEVLLLTDRPLRFDECAEVTIEECRISQLERPGPVVVIGGADRIHVTNSMLDGQIDIDDRHPREFTDGVLDEREPGAFAVRAGELAARLAAAPAAERKDLAGKITRATRIRGLSTGERGSYASFATLLAAERPDRGALAAAVGKIRDAARLAGVAPALALRDAGAEVLIDGCVLRGGLVVYGTSAERTLDLQRLAALRAAQREGRFELSALGSLHVRDTRLTRIALADEVIEAIEPVLSTKSLVLPAFRALHAADVEVEREATTVAAVDVTFGALDFVTGDQDVGVVLADSAIVTATRAPNDIRLFVLADALSVAGNLRINVVGM